MDRGDPERSGHGAGIIFFNSLRVLGTTQDDWGDRRRDGRARRCDAFNEFDGLCVGQHDVEPTLPKEGEAFRWKMVILWRDATWTWHYQSRSRPADTFEIQV